MGKQKNHIRSEDLSAYLDRDLDACRMQEVGAHLKECLACTRVADELDAMRRGLAGLFEDEPQRNLWADITVRLANESEDKVRAWWQGFWILPGAAAAGAVVVLVVMLAIGGTGMSPSKHPSGPVDALTAVTNAESEYLKAIESLEKTLLEGKDGLNPATRNIAMEGLAEINRTIEKVRAEMGRNPADLETRESMLAVYQQKVDFMSELVTDNLAE